ncbi:hypothetical protein ALC53_08389, partial [Atta colombica]
ITRDSRPKNPRGKRAKRARGEYVLQHVPRIVDGLRHPPLTLLVPTPPCHYYNWVGGVLYAARIDEQGGRRQWARSQEGVTRAETFPPSETPEEEDQEDSWYRRSVDKRNHLKERRQDRKRRTKQSSRSRMSDRNIRSSGLMRLCAVETDSRGRERSALRSRSPGSSGSSGNLCPQPARRADAISFVRKQRECEKTECRAAEQVPRFPEADRRQWWVQRW